MNVPVMRTSEALVFDIKRFAVHDGDGLRTTVFFKGCPLRCRWCQNPEGLEALRQPVYLKKQCIGCGRCVKASTDGQVTWDQGPVLHREKGDFEAVADACPAGAIRYDSQPYSLEQLMEQIRSDEVFFRHGGGVTFSGGEPLMQGEFLKDILRSCKEEGLHTAVESSFYGDPDLVKAIAPDLDRIFADMKVFDEKDHEKCTGVNNARIKENIAWLLSSPEHRDKVIIRTPLIPGYTAMEENVGAIARWITSLYPDVKYELLNYNPLAESKYEMTGKTYGLGRHKLFTKEEMDRFKAAAKTNGIRNLIEE